MRGLCQAYRASRRMSVKRREMATTAGSLPPATRKRGAGGAGNSHNRAILWVLFETGMRATELCALRLDDVDRAKQELLVRGAGAQERRFTLGHDGWYHLLTYLDDYRPRTPADGAQAERSSDHHILSERGQPLAKNGIMHVFERLRNRASIMGKQVTASLLLKNFAGTAGPTGKPLMATSTADEGRSDGRSTGRGVTRA
jgi:integrase